MGNFGKKVVSASLAAVTSISMLGGGSLVAVAGAATAAEIQAQINALLAQLQSLQVTTSCTAPAAPLTVGSTGANVTALQNWLIANGYGSFTATGYFGALTQAAVAKFQAAAGVTPTAGYYGPLTMAALQARCGTTTTTTTTTTGSATLQGGAGSITVSDLSTYAGEEVGEGAKNVEVMAFEVEADDDSDVEITSMKVEFVQSSSADSKDLPDYAQTISIWLNGKMIGSADADSFSENSDVWTKTISVSGAVVRAGQKQEFVIAVTALKKLDSGDIDSDSWTVDVLNVRFRDAEGVTTTQDTDGDVLEKTFDFGSFASANNVELKLTSGDKKINDAHIINVSTTGVTNNVELLSFYAEAKGNSSIKINDLPVILTTTEASGTDFDEPGDIVTTLYLFADGEKIGTQSLSGASSAPADSQTVTFTGIDYTIDAGDKVEFVVKARFIESGSVLADGDTIAANITSTERDAIVARDKTNKKLGNTEKTGTAVGNAHALYDVAFNLELVSAQSVGNKQTSDTSGVGDKQDFAIVYRITPFDGDVRIDKSCVEGVAQATSTAFAVTNAAANSTVCDLQATGGDVESDTETFLVKEGKTTTFTLTVNVTAITDAFAQVSLNGIGWKLGADGQGTLIYNFNLGDFKTNSVHLNMFP